MHSTCGESVSPHSKQRELGSRAEGLEIVGCELAPVSTGRLASSREGFGYILRHVLMSDDYQRIELITGAARRRRWAIEQKLRIIGASYEPGEFAGFAVWAAGCHR